MFKVALNTITLTLYIFLFAVLTMSMIWVLGPKTSKTLFEPVNFSVFIIPPLPEGGGGYTVLPLSVCPSVRPRYFSSHFSQ
jgi:hypothetical protein